MYIKLRTSYEHMIERSDVSSSHRDVVKICVAIERGCITSLVIQCISGSRPNYLETSLLHLVAHLTLVVSL